MTADVTPPATLTEPDSTRFAYLDTLTNRQDAVSTLYFYHPDHLGSSSWITTTDGSAVQHLHYLPWGEDFVDQRSTTWNAMYTFSAKEKDTETGYSYFGARYYSSDLSIWLSVDPMSEKYPSLSPYVYCADNPIKLVDPNGLYPKSILTYNKLLGLHGGYKFKKSAAHLLSLVSGVSQKLIEETVIKKRAAGQYRPWYRCNLGGGAITLGTQTYKTITYTENWFEDDPNAYKGHGYGQDIIGWLELSAHEVGHLPQIDKKRGLLLYSLSFGVEYLRSGHDNAPSEKEADKGYLEFMRFNQFVSNNYGSTALKDLFESELSEQDKISIIDNWWTDYKKNTTND